MRISVAVFFVCLVVIRKAQTLFCLRLVLSLYVVSGEGSWHAR